MIWSSVSGVLRSSASNGGVLDADALIEGRPQPGLEATADKDGFALFRIGDAVASRDVAAAMFDALRLCSPL